jgi:hypothetical protein
MAGGSFCACLTASGRVVLWGQPRAGGGGSGGLAGAKLDSGEALELPNMRARKQVSWTAGWGYRAGCGGRSCAAVVSSLGGIGARGAGGLGQGEASGAGFSAAAAPPLEYM